MSWEWNGTIWDYAWKISGWFFNLFFGYFLRFLIWFLFYFLSFFVWFFANFFFGFLIIFETFLQSFLQSFCRSSLDFFKIFWLFLYLLFAYFLIHSWTLLPSWHDERNLRYLKKAQKSAESSCEILKNKSYFSHC